MEQLIVAYFVKEFPAFCVIRMFINVFIKRQPFFPYPESNDFVLLSKISINVILPSTPSCSSVTLSSDCPTKTSYACIFHRYVCYMLRPLIIVYWQEDIGVQTITLGPMYSSATASHTLPFYVPKHTQAYVFSECEKSNLPPCWD